MGAEDNGPNCEYLTVAVGLCARHTASSWLCYASKCRSPVLGSPPCSDSGVSLVVLVSYVRARARRLRTQPLSPIGSPLHELVEVVQGEAAPRIALCASSSVAFSLQEGSKKGSKSRTPL